MATYVYITQQCRKEIAQQQYENQIDTFKKKVESTQSLEVFDRFPPPFLKKRFERQIRLVAREYLLKEHVVVAFIRLLVRGGSEYKQFGDTGYKTLPGFEGISPELEDASLLAYIASRTEPPAPPLPVPSEAETCILHAVLNISENIYADAHCCETKMWVDAIASSTFKDWKNYFLQPVLETCDHPGVGLQAVRSNIDIQYGLVFRRIPEKKTVILFTPFKGEAPFQDVAEKYPELTGTSCPEDEVVLRRTKRAYPHEIVLNENAWLDVQNDRDGSMALSLEEVDVLESARTHSGGFPLFINGSAGSGKSTILQFLFAEYLSHSLVSEAAAGPPVLFACNDELLARCQSSVRSILRARLAKTNLVSDPEKWLKNKEAHLARSFQNFHSWLSSIASSNKFPAELLVDYARFKQWWEQKFKADPGARKLYDADVSWHVIRTYIKGISLDDVLDPEDYLEIPAKQKSVTPDTYRMVYENVWKRYHEDQKEKGLWDHQDLARYVLERELIDPTYSVVFCDEAQDFTRVELEVLHRTCLFNARTLHSYELSKVPIAFAGDPFQTLNPTGFRWEATKAFFTDKFIKTYPGQKRGNINYQELSYNYRSSHHIVRFINSLQLTRSVLFNFPEIKPQHPWEEDQNVPRVVYFERTLETMNQLKKQSEIRIVVPCEAGYEGQWAKENGLADYVQFDDTGVPKNVVSPVGVKGLEFPRVVLFGFGAACPRALRAIIERLSDNELEILPTIKEDQAIEPQYYWNKLYVAASRPRKRLFIIDDKADIEGFWKQVFDTQEATLLRNRPDEVAKWESMLGQVMSGTASAWEGDEEDSLKTAEKLEEEGRLRKDRTMLRQAALSFRDAKRFDDEKKCRAQALELELNHYEAAKLWKGLGNIKRALHAAWNARESGIKFIVDLEQNDPLIKADVHWQLAQFLENHGSLSEGVSLLGEIVSALSEPKLQERILMCSVWPSMLLLVTRSLLKLTDSDSGRWNIAYRHAKALADKGLQLPDAELGDLAYRGQQPKSAYQHWERLTITHRVPYEARFLKAKAASLPYPQSLETYSDILRHSADKNVALEVLDLVHRESAEKLMELHFPVIVRSALLIEDQPTYLSYVSKLSDLSLLASIWEATDKLGNLSEANRVFERITQVLGEEENWARFVEFFTKGSIAEIKSQRMAVRLRETPLLLIPLVIAVAEADTFNEAPNDVKTKFAESLSTRFPLSFSWKNDVHPLVVGRALERAGLFRLTLPFYEALAKQPSASKELKRWAWARWIKVKNQQVTVSGNRKGTEEIKEKLATYGFISPDNIPSDLPDPLPTFENKETLVEGTKPFAREAEPPKVVVAGQDEVKPAPEYVEGQTRQRPSMPEKGDFSLTIPLNEFEIRVFADGKRVNITHAISGEVLTLFLDKSKGMLDGEAIGVESSKHVAGLPKHWAISINLARLPQGRLDFTTINDIQMSIPVLGHG